VDSAVLQEQTQLYYAHSDSWKASDNWKRLNRKAAKVRKLSPMNALLFLFNVKGHSLLLYHDIL